MPDFTSLETDTSIHDVAVVGAGPTGLACAIEVTRRGLSVVAFEKGCVVNSLYHYPTHMTFFTTPELLEIGDIPMTALGDKPTRTEALKYYRRAGAHYNLDIRQHENVDEVGGSDGKFVLETTDRLNNKRCYRAKKVILCHRLLRFTGQDEHPGRRLG